MARLVISPMAQQDLSDIFDYIARDKPIAAANWIGKIEEKCKLIATVPDFGELRAEYGAVPSPDRRQPFPGQETGSLD